MVICLLQCIVLCGVLRSVEVVRPLAENAADVFLALEATQGMLPAEDSETDDSARRFMEMLRAADQRLASLSLTYRADYDSEAYPPGTCLIREIRAKRPHFLYHRTAHGHDRLDWRDDRLTQCTHLVDDEWVTEFPFNRSYSRGELDNGDSLPGTLQVEFLFLALGWWPFDDREPPRINGAKFMIREIVDAVGYRVSPQRVQVAGIVCRVLENPKSGDRIAVDPVRGIILARELRDPESGHTMQRFELTDHIACNGGVWIPREIRNMRYTLGAKGEPSRLETDATFVLSEIRVNDVADREFAWSPRPGSIELSSDGSYRQVVQGGVDHCDEIVGWAEQYLIASVNERSRMVSTRTLLTWLGGIVVLGGLCAGVVKASGFGG